MDLLTYNNLVPIDLGGYSDHDLDTKAVSYIRSLVGPWAHELEYMFTVEALEIWVRGVFPRDLVNDWRNHTFPHTTSNKRCWRREAALDADKARLIYLLGLYLVEAARDYMEMESIPGPIEPVHVATGARRYTFSLDPCLAHYFKFEPDP
jgi:hypothetical protein